MCVRAHALRRRVGSTVKRAFGCLLLTVAEAPLPIQACILALVEEEHGTKTAPSRPQHYQVTVYARQGLR